MSGIYIKGLEMPRSCDRCIFKVCAARALNLHITVQRADDCPLVPVPDHGRLGDLDAVVELAMQYCPDDDGACSKADVDLRDLLDEIENLPTIIPAEEGET